MEDKNKKVLLSIKDLVVKFHVRSRVLTAIRGISLDIYENESIVIVGESGSGKSVFTKTFAGMLDENGFIDNGSIIFNDDELADTWVNLNPIGRMLTKYAERRLNLYSQFELGAAIKNEMLRIDEEMDAAYGLSDAEEEELEKSLNDLIYRRSELFNLKQTFDPTLEKNRIKETALQISEIDSQIHTVKNNVKAKLKERKQRAKRDADRIDEYEKQRDSLKKQYLKQINGTVSPEILERNSILAKEIYLSVGRYGFFTRVQHILKLLSEFKKSMVIGADLDNDEVRNEIFDRVVFRVRYLETVDERLHGTCVLNLAKIKYSKDWNQIRGTKIATVFQDPMTSLNPIITIGKQITSVIIKHQQCSEVEARTRALMLMKKVGIPNAEKRFDDYPFQYSGGMRQRIVIAIALSCQPKILICDEPTTALDVTIQAQILRLLKDLQREFNYTIVFITHDLGVVANIADRVAVLYAGEIVEIGQVDDIFNDPRHPYTWALLSSLPQLAQRNTELFSIHGTPPSLYNKITGDPFAPRNTYCLKIDTLKEPPMFRVSDTHYAKTWLLDPRAPKTEKPEAIQNIHEKLMEAFNI